MKNLLVLFSLAACATEPSTPLDCADCDGKADGTNPTGHVAGLMVNAPSGAVAARILARRVDRSEPFVLESGKLRGVAGGVYCVWTVAGSITTQADCNVYVPLATNVTYDLGTVTFVHSTTDLIAGVDVPLLGGPSTLASFVSIGGAVPHVPGTFTYTANVSAPAFTFTVLADDNTTVDVTDPRGHNVLRLLPSTGRTLPDAVAVPMRLFTTVPVPGGTSINASMDYAIEDRPLVFFDAAHLFYMSNAYGPIAGTLLDFGSTVQLRRIDLDDAKVTLADNSVITEPGLATIELVTDVAGVTHTNNRVLANQPTGYGIDVPPAIYKITTQFPDPTDATNSFQTIDTLDLR